MKMKSDLLWQEAVCQRPYTLESEHNTLTHLASTVPRGPIVWEVRGNRNKVRYLLGVERQHCRKIRDLFTTHGDIRFAEIEDGSLADMVSAKQLKITKPPLSVSASAMA